MLKDYLVLKNIISRSNIILFYVIMNNYNIEFIIVKLIVLTQLIFES